MSVHVIITGLPSEAIFPKLVFAFKGLLKKIAIKKFWIRDLTESYEQEGKQMTVEFMSPAEARKARGFFNNLPFIYGDMEYHLKARMAPRGTGGPQMETHMGDDWGHGRRPAKREQRPRSRSPGYSREASKLDMEIELLRKQRLVIEEERRLLLEQKKLEMIREYGPGASRESDDFNGYEPARKRRRPEPVQAKRPRQRSPPPAHKHPRSRPKGLPVFFQPCKKLIADMRPFIDKDTSAEEAEILVKLIRAAIRKSLAVALDGKDYMPTGEIINLYREKHPKQNDQQYVAKILANIRASYLTETKVDKEGTKAVKEENDTENQTIDKEDATEKQTDKENEGQGDQVTNDKTEPQETPANEENGTDAASDVGIKIKPETNTSQESEKVTEEVPENVSEEVAQEPKNVTGDVSQEVEKVPEQVSELPENVPNEVGQEAEKVVEVAQQPKVPDDIAQESKEVSVVTQEPAEVSTDNGPAKAVTETDDAAEFDREFALEDTETATDLLTDGDLQDADDWVDEQ